MQALTGDLWIMRFPLALLGMVVIGRTVTLIRLHSGELVIHSTAPFTAAKVAAISALGKPGALVDATLLHDTFASSGRAMFPAVPYFAPEGFSKSAGVPTSSLAVPPASWAGELEVLPLDGMPEVREHVFFHHPSRTLIVADLLFNFRPDVPRMTRFMLRWAAGLKRSPGISRVFASKIRNREAFAQSVRQMMQWDFDRVIVGHGEVLETGAKPKLAEALAAHGF